MCLAISLMFVAPRYPAEVENPYYSWGILLVFASSVVAVVLYWLVVLFNRPSFIVAPHLRGERGLLQASRDGTEGRRKQKKRSTAQSGTLPKQSRRTLSFQVSASGGLIEIGDRDAKEGPVWDSTATSAISNGSVVLVATRPPESGPVTIEVAPGKPAARGHAPGLLRAARPTQRRYRGRQHARRAA